MTDLDLQWAISILRGQLCLIRTSQRELSKGTILENIWMLVTHLDIWKIMQKICFRKCRHFLKLNASASNMLTASLHERWNPSIRLYVKRSTECKTSLKY